MTKRKLYLLPRIVIYISGNKKVNYTIDIYFYWLRWVKVFTWEENNKNKEPLPF